ncbi:MAG: YrhK family protein [Coxiellaceae bacterium]|nr:YrhK family protein [Coxiellaceae bacterium]
MLRIRVISSRLYFIGCLLLVPASAGLLLGVNALLFAISGFIVACSCLSIAASLDLYKAMLECRLSVSLYSPLCMLAGGILFLLASIAYLPLWSAWPLFHTTLSNVGTWVFRFGSLAYLVGNFRLISRWLHDVKRAGTCELKDLGMLMGVGVFILGSLLYIAGGIVAQVEISQAMLTAVFWLLGSCSFAVGATIFLNLQRAAK